MSTLFAAADPSAVPLHIIAQDDFDTWRSAQSPRIQAWVDTNGFTASLGQTLIVPSETGEAETALAGYGTETTRARGRFHLAAAAAKLPKGKYTIVSDLAQDRLENEVLGWLLASYRFGNYASAKPMAAELICPGDLDAKAIEAVAAGEFLTRDLINTPSNDMGPAELETAARELAGTHKANIEVISGDDLLAQNFPLIHTVGRASDREPRLIDMRWGKSGPKVTLVGKGVCFDTGGLNLKPGGSMGLMKKVMGGAANVLGLARMIMAQGTIIQLRVLIPAVENAVSGSAFRPGDILTSRKGLTV